MPEPSTGDAALEREVRTALARDPVTAALAGAPLEVQRGGLSNHAWLARRDGLRYFVRLSPPDAARLGVDRENECALLGQVARAGLAPQVVRCDPSQRLLVTRHIEGRPLARDEAVTPRNLARLGEALRSLHALPVPAGLRRVDFAVQAAHLEAQCVGASPVGDELQARAREVFALLSGAARPDTLCHNDLHHLNLVDDGERLWLVDWEYGGAGDAAFDCASFLCQHDCGPQERESLRLSCGGGLAVQHLQAACWAFDYVQWLWYRAWTARDPVYAERARTIERRLRSGTRSTAT